MRKQSELRLVELGNTVAGQEPHCLFNQQAETHIDDKHVPHGLGLDRQYLSLLTPFILLACENKLYVRLQVSLKSLAI